MTDHDGVMEQKKKTIEEVIRERIRMLNRFISASDRPLVEYADEGIERVASAFCTSRVATVLYSWLSKDTPLTWIHTYHGDVPFEGYELRRVEYILCDEFMMNPNEVEIGKAILAHIPNPSDEDKALVELLAFVVRKRRIRGPQLVKP